MTKTLVVSRIFPPEIGGSGRWLWELYTRLPQGEYCVVANESAGSEDFDQSHDLPIIRMPLSVGTWGAFGWNSGANYLGLYRRLSEVVEQRDVSQLHAACVLPEGFLAWALERRMGLPYILYVHGEELNIVQRSRELTWMARRVLGNASRIITNSNNTARLLLADWPVQEERLRVLHPGVDTRKFCPAPRDEQIRRRLGWEGRPVVLTVGRLQARKGQDQFIRALPEIRRRVPDVLYSIVGDGKDRGRLQALVGELGLDDCVKFQGELQDEELVTAFQQCDLFALPNREERGDIEGFGIVLLEAQACGKPVLAGCSGGTSETMKPGESGVLVDCTKSEQIAAETISLLSDPDRLSYMGKQGRDLMCSAFDWDICAEQAQSALDLTPPLSQLVAQDR